MTHFTRIAFSASLAAFALAGVASAQSFVPKRETTMERVERTTYREEVKTEFRESTRTVWTPVTEYRCEAYWANLWSPFSRPYLAYRQVPRTRWVPKQEVVKTPVIVRTLVPEKQMVEVPVTKRWLAKGDGAAGSGLAKKPDPFSTLKQQTTASLPAGAIGGVRIDSDPPRNPNWQSFRGRRF